MANQIAALSKSCDYLPQEFGRTNHNAGLFLLCNLLNRPPACVLTNQNIVLSRYCITNHTTRLHLLRPYSPSLVPRPVILELVSLKVVPPDCLWQNVWSPQTVCGRTCGPPGLSMTAISGPPLHSPPLLLCCTIGCAIINSTMVPILLCEQSLTPYFCLAVSAHSE